MAQKVQVLLLDDLDGGDASETITFSLDGKSYEIDLSDKNAGKLRKVLEPYAKAGRRSGKGGPKTAKRATAGSSEDTARIREWAKANGYEVNDRGRISAPVREAYAKANS